MKRKIDYSIYLVTDQSLMSTNTLTEAVEQAILGGCTLVQLREKELSSLEFYQTAIEIRRLTNQYNIPLIINDRIDIALAVGADGVHIGQSDIPATVARRIIGDDLVLGVSVHSAEEAVQAIRDGADCLGVGAMFATATKEDAKMVTMAELRRIRAAVDVPIVVIGGINKKNALSFKRSGADGIAVVSAILSQEDITVATEELTQLWNTPSAFKGAIFDLDGTLLDSMDVWERIDIAFLAKHGLAVPEGYMVKICTMSFAEAAAYTVARFNLPEKPEEIVEEWNRMAIDEYSHRVTLKSHALAYLQKLKACGVKLAIATALPKALYEPVLKNNGIYEMFDAITSTDEVGKGKSFPDVFRLAVKKLSLPPRECIVFEDVLQGILSAKEAGLMTYGVYDQYSEALQDDIKKAADGYICCFEDAPMP